MMSEAQKNDRDMMLRRRVLQLLDEVRGSGMGLTRWLLLKGLSGLADAERPESDAHLEELCHDLAGDGLVSERDLRIHADEARTASNTEYRITTSGTALLRERIPANPLVEDRRIRR